VATTASPAPFSSDLQIGEPFEREPRPILGGAEQRLGKGIVIADAWARLGWLDAEPLQHGQPMAALRVASLSPCSTGRADIACTATTTTADI
jgi:hypothetical protein